MANLIIIGNGYDLDHQMKTSYSHFKQWLFDKNLVWPGKGQKLSGAITPFPLVPETTLDHHGEYIVSLKDTANLLFSIIQGLDPLVYKGDDQWSYFEDNLKKVDFWKTLQMNLLLDRNDIDHFACYLDEINQKAVSLDLSAKSIKDLFSLWVNSVEEKPIETAFDKWIKSLNEKTIIISFNYTHVMERIGYQNIYHIHGETCAIPAYSNIIVGYGDNYEPLNIPEENDDSDIEDDVWKNALSHINNVYQTLHKNVDKIINDNKDLWDTISNSFSNDKNNRIIVFGLSHSNSDEKYIKKFIDCTSDNNVDLFLNNYGNNAKNHFEIWRNNGFCCNDKRHVYSFDLDTLCSKKQSDE